MKLIVAFLCVASLLVPMPTPAMGRDSPESPDVIKWGPLAKGLQMLVIPESEVGILHCWIRNGLATEVSYNSDWLGYWEGVSVELKQGEEWRRLPRVKSSRVMKGTAPNDTHLRTLEPFQSIERGMTRFAATRQNRADGPLPSQLRATYLVDLCDFDWPVDAFSSPVEVRVSQMLFGPGHDEPLTIQSLAVRLHPQAMKRILKMIQTGSE